MRKYTFASSLSDRAEYIRNVTNWAEECAARNADDLRAQLECIDDYAAEYVDHIPTDDRETAHDYAAQAFRRVFEARLAELERENDE